MAPSWPAAWLPSPRPAWADPDDCRLTASSRSACADLRLRTWEEQQSVSAAAASVAAGAASAVSDRGTLGKDITDTLLRAAKRQQQRRGEGAPQVERGALTFSSRASKSFAFADLAREPDTFAIWSLSSSTALFTPSIFLSRPFWLREHSRAHTQVRLRLPFENPIPRWTMASEGRGGQGGKGCGEPLVEVADAAVLHCELLRDLGGSSIRDPADCPLKGASPVRGASPTHQARVRAQEGRKQQRDCRGQDKDKQGERTRRGCSFETGEREGQRYLVLKVIEA